MTALWEPGTQYSYGDIVEFEEKLTCPASAPGDTVDGDVESGLMGSEPSEFLRASHGTGIEQADISGIRRKLDVLLGLSALQKNSASFAASKTLQPDTAQLEAFVNGSTAQIGGIAEDVQKLRKALGGVDELQDVPEDNSDPTAAIMTVLQSVQKLIADNQWQDRDSTHLLTTMNGLAAALNKDMRKNAEMQNAYSTLNAIFSASLIGDEIKRECHVLLRTRSDDIHGERLRFVEVMKEATAINVQSMLSDRSSVATIELTLKKLAVFSGSDNHWSNKSVCVLFEAETYRVGGETPFRNSTVATEVANP
ncbi:hypothetical protein EDB84DRAFT_1569331 [Lactarius hengduanensis]|nr:hypothetical protein EDB84DRAFT_1571330 [Lactarius hengduanensis]KAH9012137.1 hypothetical protein EDB84DRAFT_1569331 [Lactarius hengduanensis]